MKRITYKDAAGRWVIACNKFWNWIENKLPAHLRGEAVDRLAAIEEVLGDEYDLDRLRDLVEADKAGRCVVLPCKPGDTVYMLSKSFDDFFGERCIVICSQFRLSLISKIGKTVFLTREEAEAALAKEISHE